MLPNEEKIQSKLVNTNSPGFNATSPMTPLSLLDGAEVKNNKCPVCKTSLHLERCKGFKICPYCGTLYKIFNNVANIVNDNNADEKRDINEMILKNNNINRLYN